MAEMGAGLEEGLGFMGSQEYARAIVSFQELARKEGAGFETCELQGMCYFHMGDWKSAERNFSAAVSYLESPKPNLYHYRGLCRVYLGEFSEAAEDLILAIRYTPFEILNEKAELLGAAFFACVLAKDGRAQRIFQIGYSHCPLALVEEVGRIFVPYIARAKMPEKGREAVRVSIEALRKRALIDQALFERRAKKRGEELTGLLGKLGGLKIRKKGEGG